MKKILSMVLAMVMMMTSAVALAEEIDVISREDGSGTRGAFIELFGIEQKNEAGEKIDYTTDECDITNSTSVMMTSVAGNECAIGYISLGSMNETVKALTIDGAAASVDNIKNGSYMVARPFNIATTAEVSDVVEDFIAFIMSAFPSQELQRKNPQSRSCRTPCRPQKQEHFQQQRCSHSPQ